MKIPRVKLRIPVRRPRSMNQPCQTPNSSGHHVSDLTPVPYGSC